MIKIFSIIMITLLIVIFLNRTQPEFSLLVIIAAVILIFAIISNDLYAVVQRLTSLSDKVGNVQPYIKLMLKILGLSLIAQLVSDMCRDCSQTTLANQAEIASKIIILVMTLPLFEAVIDIVTGLLK